MHMTNRSTQKQHFIIIDVHISLGSKVSRQKKFKKADIGLMQDGIHPGKMYLQALTNLWV
jgi:hypothetical protein